jgi:hypothetical protein
MERRSEKLLFYANNGGELIIYLHQWFSTFASREMSWCAANNQKRLKIPFYSILSKNMD